MARLNCQSIPLLWMRPPEGVTPNRIAVATSKQPGQPGTEGGRHRRGDLKSVSAETARRLAKDSRVLALTDRNDVAEEARSRGREGWRQFTLGNSGGAIYRKFLRRRSIFAV